MFVRFSKLMPHKTDSPLSWFPSLIFHIIFFTAPPPCSAKVKWKKKKKKNMYTHHKKIYYKPGGGAHCCCCHRRFLFPFTPFFKKKYLGKFVFNLPYSKEVESDVKRCFSRKDGFGKWWKCLSPISFVLEASIFKKIKPFQVWSAPEGFLSFELLCFYDDPYRYIMMKQRWWTVP